MNFNQTNDYLEGSHYLRNCDSSNGYEIGSQDNNDHFNTLFNQASEKQQRIVQKQEELNDEIKSKANKTKIDQHSQKILLKKLESQINAAMNRYQIDEQLNFEGFCSFTIDLGISNRNDNVVNDLWKLLTLGLDLENSYIGFVFNVLVILLEKQLLPQQALNLLNEVIKVEIEDQNINQDIINFDELDQIANRLINKFRFISLRSSHNSRTQSSAKKEISQQTNCFKPTINNKSKQMNETLISDTINRYEILYEHSKVLQEKKRFLESQIQDDPECSFKPYLTSIQTKRQDNTFNRLYQNAEAIKIHKQKLKEQLNRQKQEEELQECTFKPKIVGKQRYSYKPVKGEQVIIERMNKARQMKQEKENFYTVEHCTTQNNVKQHQTIPEPFDLSSKPLNSKQMILNVDIKISKSRKAKICIREGDDIDQVIQGFAKVHQLNQEQQLVLKETIQSYLN